MPVDTTIILKDASNSNIVMKAKNFSGGLAFYHVIDERLSPAINRSGTITTASTSQEVAPDNPDRTGFTFQNVSDTNMYLSEDGTTASTADFLISPGMRADIETSSSISVFCSNAGKAFAASERVI